jgi:uncharacterized coiled-coil protein SlyX
MALSNAESQKRLREKRDALARQAGIAKNAVIDFLIKERQARERELIEARAEIEHLRKRVAELEARREKTLEKLRDKVECAEKLLDSRNAEIRNLKGRLSLVGKQGAAEDVESAAPAGAEPAASRSCPRRRGDAQEAGELLSTVQRDRVRVSSRGRSVAFYITPGDHCLTAC